MQEELEAGRTFEYAPGVTIHYEVRGRGTRPALLMHGFGASLETWRDIQPYLEPYLLLYLVDLKGFGLSSKPDDGRYSIPDQAAIIASFLERLGLSGVCLIGHSYGGVVALMTYLGFAETSSAGRIDSLVVIDSPVTADHLPFFIRLLRNPLFRMLLRFLPARVKARYVLRRISYGGTVSRQRVERHARFLKLPGSHRALVALARQIVPEHPERLVQNLGSIRVPLLLLWGDRDPVILRRHADLLNKAVPDSKLVVIPRCGHMPPEERPEATAREILEFAREQPERERPG